MTEPPVHVPQPTNINWASKYAMNVADDLPLAIYDILPNPTLMQERGSGDGYYSNQEFPDPPHPHLLDEPNRWSWFSIPSQHTVHNSKAFYLRSRYDGESEWPEVSGLPMVYGGYKRTRYSLLNRDVSVSEPPLPFLQVPSFGVGQTYEDRARSIEFWLDTDPYHHPVNMNLFDDQTAIYSPEMMEGDHYTLVGTGYIKPENVTEPLRNEECNIIGLDNTKITFTKDQPVVASRRVYTFAITAKNYSTSERADITISLKFTQNRINEAPFVKTYTDTFQVYKADGWTVLNVEFVPNEAMTFPTLEVSLSTDHAMYLTEMGVWAGQGGTWQPPGVDTGADIEFFTTARPTELLSVGGINGSAVELLADDSYFYLRSVDKIDSYYVGQWGRQMHICLIDEGVKYSLYLNSEPVLTVPKVNTAVTGVNGEYAIFYISPLFKYIDISTIAIYPNELPIDIMKLHYIYGGGPKYADVIKRMPYESMYVADGSAIQFSGHTLFPQSHGFGNGTSYGVDITGSTLSLPDYPLPKLLNADSVDFQISSTDEYSMLCFKVPDRNGAVMQWRPRVDIHEDVNYIFIDIASLLVDNIEEKQTKKICTIEPSSSSVTDFILEFFITIDINSDGDYEDEDFNRDYATTEKSGVIYANMRNAEGSTEVFRQDIIQSDFSLVFNIDKLRNHEQYPVSVIFSDKEFVITFGPEADLKSLSCCTRENLYTGGILFEGETDLDAIQIDNRYDDFGTDTRGVIQNATYSVYPNVSIVDGDEVIFLDRSANGYWKVNIPLVNLAASISGRPDLDFIMYSDSERLPQIVSGLNTNRLTYSEVATYIAQKTQSMGVKAGKYSGAQDLFATTPYMEVGLEAMNVIPTLGRFANPSVQTFVTLDSQSRFPFKDYSKLKKVKATTSMFIDFENSTSSILDSKWEIFNNYAIRVPRNISLDRYQLAYVVHLRASSLTLQKPVFRNADFFGVSSGTNIINGVNTGTGGPIYIGNADQYGEKTPYSAHLPTETFASMHMTKSFGFYPHSEVSAEGMGNIVYQFMKSKSVGTVSFYFLWRNETFPHSEQLYGSDLIDNIGFFNYTNDSDVDVENILRIKSRPGLVKTTANLEFSNAGPTIYIDGQANNFLWVNKWHLVQIDFTGIKSGMSLSQVNSKVVMNYVSASTKVLDPVQLYASRVGIPNVFIDDEDSMKRNKAQGYLLSLPESSSYKDFADMLVKL